MKVENLMTKEVFTCSPDETLHDAARGAARIGRDVAGRLLG